MAGNKLGEIVRELREMRGLTQVQLAEKAQIAISHVVVIESTQPGNPSRQILQRLARALDVPAKRLLEPKP